MEKLNLDGLNVKQLSRCDAAKIDGGGFLGFVSIMGAAIYMYNNWDDFTQGFSDGWNGEYNRP